MIRHQALEREHLPRRDVNKAQFIGTVTDLILPDDSLPAPRPQAFLVEQIPHWTLPVHFHEEHQFQVVVQGGGRLGAQPVQLLDVHYASPHTAYGPLVSGDAGVSYLTLRAVGDTGAWYLPQAREHNLRIPKLQAHGTPSQAVDAQALLTLARPATEALIEPQAGGLAAWLVQLGPGQSAPQPEGAHEGGGRFLVVGQGALRVGGDLLPPPGVAWVGAEDSLDLLAGPQGAAVVVLQFPAEAARSFVESLGRSPGEKKP